MHKGKLIVIDGLDGSGKKTQLDLLQKYCRQKKIKTAAVDFPQYNKTFFGETVGRYLKGEFGTLDQTNPYLASLTFAGDRWQAKKYIRDKLDLGFYVLANRYTTSSITFMAGKFISKKEQSKFSLWLEKLEYEIYQVPKEDFVIYLSVPPDLGQKLVLNKGKRKYMGNKNKHDIHEENAAYLKRVQAIYLQMAKNNKNWAKIECLQNNKLLSRQDIHQKIIKVLKQKKLIV